MRHKKKSACSFHRSQSTNDLTWPRTRTRATAAQPAPVDHPRPAASGGPSERRPAVSSIVDHLAQAESWTAGAAARVAAAQSNRRRGAGPTVYLNVYDLSNVGGTDLTGTLASLNRTLMRSWDVGLFHAGVEVAGVEYSYGYCEEGTGVFACEPRDACGAKFRQAIPMGRAPSDARIIERRLARLVATWPGDAYALLQRNCCHFCDALCRSLGVGPIPAWVNGLAASVRGATEFSLFGASQAPSQRVKPSVAVDVDDAASDATSQTGTTDDGRREETDDSFDSDASDRRPRWSVDVGPFALGRGWAPAPTPSEELGRRHTSPGRARPLNGAAPPGDGASDSSETDEEASAIARWLTYRRSVEEEERRTSARPIVERAVAEEQAVDVVEGRV